METGVPLPCPNEPKTFPILSQIIQIDRIPKMVFHTWNNLLYESSPAFPPYIQNIV
jgi:hypothetical protein